MPVDGLTAGVGDRPYDADTQIILDVGHHDGSAFRRDLESHRPPDSACGAGDQSHSLLEPVLHAISFSGLRVCHGTVGERDHRRNDPGPRTDQCRGPGVLLDFYAEGISDAVNVVSCRPSTVSDGTPFRLSEP